MLVATKAFKTAILTAALVYTAGAHSFTREFTQDNNPSVFHDTSTNTELCLFVFSRHGALLVQPHCMKSGSSHRQESTAYLSRSAQRASTSSSR